MKILKYFTLLAATVGIMSACTTDLEMVQTLPADQVVAPVLHELETTDVVITAETLVNTLTVSWDAAYFGDKIVPSYSVLISKDDVEVPVIVGVTKLEATLTYEQINLAAASSVEDGGLGLILDVASDVKLRIGATIGNSYDTYYSEAQDIKITPTSAEKKYPMIYMPGSYQGWAPADAATKFQVLYDFSGSGVFEGVADFGAANDASREWKFTKDANWDFDWGIPSGETPEAEAAEVTLINNDGGDRSNINIYTVNRYYHFSMDTGSGLLKKNYSFDQVGVVGEITGWADGQDKVMEFNAAKRRFWVDIENLSGQFKFRLDGKWDKNWGANDFGVEVSNGDGNLEAEAGNYRVYLYLSNPAELSYELSADMYGKEEPTGGNTTTPEPPAPPVVEKEPNRWGIVGDLTGWGEQADLYMDEVGTDVYVRRSLALTTANMFKIRFNDEWKDDANYGLEEDGAVNPNEGFAVITSGGSKNIMISADGTYDVWFNKAESKVWVMTEGQTPEGITLKSVKLYVNVSAPGWENCNIWAWDGDGANYSGGTWPGQALATETVDGVEYYVWEAPVAAVGKTISVIFNNGSAQTADITGVVLDKDHFFVLNDDLSYTMDGEAPEAPVSSVKLYANVSAPGWENCNIWAWDGDGANYSGGTWPGQALATETVDGVEYYVWEAPVAAVGKTISVIFNNGSAQTADITGVVLDKNHFFVINADLSYTMDGDAPATPDPSDIVYGLVGTINGWSAPDINFEDNGDGGYKLLGYTLTASDEIKIRANGTWNDATNYGLEQAGVLVTNEANVLICGGGSKNMKVAADGTYDFYFYPEELKLYVMEQGKVPTR